MKRRERGTSDLIAEIMGHDPAAKGAGQDGPDTETESGRASDGRKSESSRGNPNGSGPLPGKPAMGGERPKVLEVNRLKKKIKGKWIIKGVTFDIRAGDIFGFLGPNGSGKTTTIRMLVGLIRPTEGIIRICGHDVTREHNAAMANVGCIVENPELYMYMSGWDNLEHYARMLPGVGEERIWEVVRIVGMEQRIHDKVKTYSLGMRQRLGIAQALLGEPKLLILDEPTNGLDPQGIKELRDFIRKLADGGLSIFISSHLLSEIQQMCDRVAIISHGEVIAVGDVQELLTRKDREVVWTVDAPEPALTVVRKLKSVALQEHGVLSSSEAAAGTGGSPGAGYRIATVMQPEQIPELNENLVAYGVKVFGVVTKHPSLEDLFLRLTEGERID